jgi:hypothetical protein
MDPELSLFARVKQFLRRIFGSRFGSGNDPYAGVRTPKTRGPVGRSPAIALAEPEEDEFDMSAVGVGRGRARR